MHPPFTSEQFFEVFRHYNETVWPVQIVLVVVGLVTVVAAYRANALGCRRWAQAAILLLAVLWLWTGMVYHYTFFATITPAGKVFAAFCVAQAGVLLFCAWRSSAVSEPATRPSMIAGAILLVYALVLYPLLGIALGHRYPSTPSFGAPCPTTIFTFGIFCLLPRTVRRFALAIPVLWAVIGSSAILTFGMREDVGLAISAAAAIAVMVREGHRGGVIGALATSAPR